MPRKLTWRHHLAAWAIAATARALSLTWRVRFIDPHGVLREPPQIIGAIWHNRLALCTTIWKRTELSTSGRGMAALISASHDGGILSQVIGRFGMTAVRGSSSRRGAQALLEMTSHIQRGYHGAITPDGPRGPCYSVHPGIIGLAQVTGVPIMPVSGCIRGKFVFKSWDRFQLPLPFARCDIRIGELLHVPKTADEAERENLRLELQKRLMAITED